MEENAKEAPIEFTVVQEKQSLESMIEGALRASLESAKTVAEGGRDPQPLIAGASALFNLKFSLKQIKEKEAAASPVQPATM